VRHSRFSACQKAVSITFLTAPAPQ
jgi:hypothetical protein